MCAISSKLTIKTQERRQQRPSDVFFLNFKHIFTPFSNVSIVDFELVNVGSKTWSSQFSRFSIN